jgi:hypothetical protein
MKSRSFMMIGWELMKAFEVWNIYWPGSTRSVLYRAENASKAKGLAAKGLLICDMLKRKDVFAGLRVKRRKDLDSLDFLNGRVNPLEHGLPNHYDLEMLEKSSQVILENPVQGILEDSVHCNDLESEGGMISRGELS